AKRPSPVFLQALNQAGFPVPEFIELAGGSVDAERCLRQRGLGSLRPWAWGPDSVELLKPLLTRVTGEIRATDQYFNDDIARLYSKTWSAGFLRKILARFREGLAATSIGAQAPSPWLCSEQDAGTTVGALEDALEVIAAIRSRGHHRVVVKEAHGLAGHNAIRLWEPELLPAQRQWLGHALRQGRQVVIEPWHEREVDFSIQLEMGRRGLELCGYTGLINDRKGQFLANWAESGYKRCLPAKVSASFRGQTGITGHLQDLYDGIFTLLEAELRAVGFLGPISIDAFVYRTAQGESRLKPIVEINPRYTMGRLTVELMKHSYPGSFGLFRLVNPAQARAKGYTSLSSYGSALGEVPRRLEGDEAPKIRAGAFCLNDPQQAQVCLATFEVGEALNVPAILSGDEAGRSP
ncbi:MAG TPA: hypothetical protein VN673_07695, partial [Clostridia bacterium]|nr:hypothetical protein [Clostridia bacterium]